ncbi:MAG: hypothetical protein GY874_01740 [Desulfobacteraceae bacterium]|nr:hypothetical protein [Desulfobacteraceae bacterium]
MLQVLVKNRTAMVIGFFMLNWLILLFATASSALANPKADDLKQKMADMNLIQQQLLDRSNQTAELLKRLSEQQKELISEIHIIVKSEKIKTLKQAEKIERIQYNLELLGMLKAYTNVLESKILFYQSGRDRLSYLHQQAKDDIKLMSAISDLQVDALTTQVSLLINRYIDEAHVIKIDLEKIVPIARKRMWNSIVRRR